MIIFLNIILLKLTFKLLCLSCFRRQVLTTLGHEMILKVRVADSEDPDYIEIELPGDSLTLDTLTLVAASELGVQADQVTTKSY